MADEKQLEIEEVVPPKEEKPDPMEQLQEQLKAMQAQLDEAKNQSRDLGSKLTKVQQDNAELIRFHKATLPKINKTFEEQWEADPQRAVVTEVEQRTQPVVDQTTRLSAELALVKIITKNPAWASYEDKVREKAQRYPEMTYRGEDGIMELFKMVHADHQEMVKKPNGDDVDKSKAITEQPSGRAPQKTENVVRLNPDQARVAKMLGVKPEDYAKRLKEFELAGQ